MAKQDPAARRPGASEAVEAPAPDASARLADKGAKIRASRHGSEARP